MVDASPVYIQDIQSMVWEAIRKTINKFRENPYYFFTESDLVTYTCQSLYSGKLEVVHDNRRIYCVHREYPTNFRYDRDHLLDAGYEPYHLQERRGTRGNFDLVVLNPEFVRNPVRSIDDIVNKNVRDLESRTDSAADELLFAIEFKYIINSSRTFEHEVRKDNVRLKFALQNGAIAAINLVFCNTDAKYRDDFREAALSANPKVTSIFVMSYYEGDTKKTPVPETNSADSTIRKLIGAKPQHPDQSEAERASSSNFLAHGI